MAPGGARLAPTPGKQSVWFNLSLSTVHEIPAYMEIYGRHPREFVFGRGSEMLPAGDRFGFVGLSEENHEEEDDSSEGDAQEEPRPEEQDKQALCEEGARRVFREAEE